MVKLNGKGKGIFMDLPETMYSYRYQRKAATQTEKCSVCSNNIYKWENHYKIENVVVCDDCIISYIKKYRIEGK